MKLKLAHKTRYPWGFAAGCVVLIPLVLLFAPNRQIEAVIAVVGMVGGFTHFLYSQHDRDTQLFYKLFTEFTKRYDDLNNDLNDIVCRLARTADTAMTDEEKGKLYDYFNLCAEEYLFYEAGYIDREVWRAWCRGMTVFAEAPAIRALWEEELRTGSYYGFSLDKIRGA